jgi:hypothetical protein
MENSMGWGNIFCQTNHRRKESGITEKEYVGLRNDVDIF